MNDCQSVIRGTLRYKGFADVMGVLLNIGLMNPIPISEKSLNWNDTFVTKTLLNDQKENLNDGILGPGKHYSEKLI